MMTCDEGGYFQEVSCDDIARFDRLEAENAALWAFVRADDEHQEFRRTVPEDGMELWIARWESLLAKAKDAREALRQYEDLKG